MPDLPVNQESIIFFFFFLVLQKNSLQSLYEKKVKKLVNRLLTHDGSSVRSVTWISLSPFVSN